MAKQTIGDRAMLVSLTIHRWIPTTSDEKVRKEVAEAHNSDKNLGMYKKRILPYKATLPIALAANALRQKHNYLTLPWSDDGFRILSSTGYFRYTEEMAKDKAAFDKEVRTFLPLYACKGGFKEQAKSLLNGLYNEDDYPDEKTLARKFGIDMKVKPIPSGNDFRVDVGAENVARIREEIEADTKAVIETAMKDIWARLAGVVGHAADRLKKYNVTAEGKTENKFRDSLITNIRDLLDIVPSLNITGDLNVTKFANRIKNEIASYEPEVLRDDAAVRSTVAAKADDILTKMKGFIA